MSSIISTIIRESRAVKPSPPSPLNFDVNIHDTKAAVSIEISANMPILLAGSSVDIATAVIISENASIAKAEKPKHIIKLAAIPPR